MSETLTVTVDDGGTYTVDVKGVSLFTDAGLTTPATFPVSVSADTTWYAAAPSRAGRRDNIEVVVTTSVGTRIPVETFNGLPVTVNLTEGTVDYSAPAPSTASSSVSWTAVKTADYAASAGDAVPADASGGAFNVTLPAPAANARVTVKNIGATGTVTVLPHAAETIDGASSYPIDTQWTSRDFQSDGTNWLVV